MKAIVVSEAKKISVIEKEIPKIKNQDDVLIKVKAGGICGSDIHIYHGTSPVATYPRILGHEIVGEVVEIGYDVKELSIGDRVVVEPIISCGECYACKSGRPNVCEKLLVRGCHTDGGFQEYYVVPEKNLYKFNKEISWKYAAMIEPYTIGAQITWRADIKVNDIVLIMGAGPIGLTVLEMALLKGGICIISDYDKKRLEVAKNIGAHYIIDLNSKDIREEIMKITNNMGANVVIDAVCTPKTFESSVELASVAGRVMCLGFTKEISEIAQLNITSKELDIKGSRHQTFKFKEVVELFNQNKLKVELLVSHTFSFEEIEKAIELIEKKEDNVCKVLLLF